MPLIDVNIDFDKREAKTQALALALSAVIGSYPKITRYEDKNIIELYPEQIEKAQNILIDWIESEPGDVQIDVKPVIFPVIMRKYWPWLIGIPAGVILAGFLIGKIGKR